MAYGNRHATSTSTEDAFEVDGSLSSSSGIDFRHSALDIPEAKAAASRKVATAVFAHIRAMRVLGYESVNTADISRALRIELREVEEAVRMLREKGVKPNAR